MINYAISYIWDVKVHLNIGSRITRSSAFVSFCKQITLLINLSPTNNNNSDNILHFLHWPPYKKDDACLSKWEHTRLWHDQPVWSYWNLVDRYVTIHVIALKNFQITINEIFVARFEACYMFFSMGIPAVILPKPKFIQFASLTTMSVHYARYVPL